MTALKLDQVQALTFDCYGTIIDWDGGIETGFGAMKSLVGADLARLVSDREREEYELLAGPFCLYGEVLAESLRRAAALQGLRPTPAEVSAFVLGMGDWPVFPDSPAALQRLAKRFRLALLSNVENETLARSAAQTGATFAARVSAEDVRSYKPARKHFDEGLRCLGLGREAVLHVAGSLYHDIRPARELGWSTVWINRRAEAIPDDVDPAHVFADLEALALACG